MSTTDTTAEEDRVSDATPEGDIPDATPQGSDSESHPDETAEGDTFPRSYVEELRQENARYRQRAQQADGLAHRLHTELVRATGRLADPTDLPFDPDHLDGDGVSLTQAIAQLLTSKPHLAARKPAGDIGQGAMSAGSANVDLAAILRGKAR